jgi:outer membrane protein
MKKRIALSLITLISCVAFTQSQDLKLGHVNSQELLQAMPESDSAQAKLQNAAQQLEATMEEMQVEFNKKYDNYINNSDELSDLVRQTKETELAELQNRIQQFQATAEQDLQKQRQKFFQPIQEKARKAIEKVAQENGYTYVFDTGIGTIIYAAENTDDLMPLVKKELGIQ